MKSILLSFLMASAIMGISQNADKIAMYTVGCEHMPEYKIEIKSCSAEVKELSNGRIAPALSCFITDKEEFVGGELIFKDSKTEITDIVMVAHAEGALFTVKGRDFNMSFTLISGMILRIGEETIFHTDKKGIWSIRKKS